MYDLDLSLFTLIHNLAGHNPLVDNLIVFFAEYFQYFIAAALIVYASIQYRTHHLDKAFGVILAVVAGVLGRGGVEVIRFFYHHARPFVTLHLTPLFPETSYSFPSGHAIFFFALAMGIYMIDRPLGKVLFIAATFIGLARIAGGVHWPSDILAGAVLGIIVGYGIAKVGARLIEWKKEKIK